MTSPKRPKLDPGTLRWAADILHSEAEGHRLCADRYDGMLRLKDLRRDHEVLHRHKSTLVRRLRNLATREEKRR
jgi:hypothetical protein